MRKTLFALLLGLAALTAAACGNSSSSTAPGSSTETLAPIVSPSESTMPESPAPVESTEVSPASS
jgi:ABC-type glycerol-3-phosphate transport system substrate-binding protein